VQLESPDPEARRGAAMKLGHQAAAGAAPVVEAAIKKETVPNVRHALEEALALIRLANGDAAVRVLAAQSLGALHSSDAMPALQKLAADPGASPVERDTARAAIRQIERWGLLVRTVETVFQGRRWPRSSC
jgi:HEAT repeat protein